MLLCLISACTVCGAHESSRTSGTARLFAASVLSPSRPLSNFGPWNEDGRKQGHFHSLLPIQKKDGSNNVMSQDKDSNVASAQDTGVLRVPSVGSASGRHLDEVCEIYEDSLDYKDKWGYPCSDWVGYSANKCTSDPDFDVKDMQGSYFFSLSFILVLF